MIPYLGLSNGAHKYQFVLDKEFFARFETSTVQSGKFDVDVVFEKQDRTVVLHIACRGSLYEACDRCLADIPVDMAYTDMAILKIIASESSTEDEVYYFRPDTSHIDLSEILHESILLHTPLVKVRDCAADGHTYCDQKVLDRWHVREQDQDDPGEDKNPWSALKDLEL